MTMTSGQNFYFPVDTAAHHYNTTATSAENNRFLTYQVKLLKSTMAATLQNCSR